MRVCLALSVVLLSACGPSAASGDCSPEEASAKLASVTPKLAGSWTLSILRSDNKTCPGTIQLSGENTSLSGSHSVGSCLFSNGMDAKTPPTTGPVIAQGLKWDGETGTFSGKLGNQFIREGTFTEAVLSAQLYNPGTPESFYGTLTATR